MVTHEGPLLELGPWRAGKQHPPGPGGADAQQVGGAGGGHVSVVARHFPRTGELIRTADLYNEDILRFKTVILLFWSG